MDKRMNFEWLLFDIGGVLVELTGASKLMKWMNWRVDQEEMNRMWLYSEAVRSFETGRITSYEFAETVIKEFEFSVTSETFIEEFSNFPKGLYAGAEALLAGLSAQYSIATLSNTNAIHWDKLCKEDHLDNLLQTQFLSFQTGYMKPDRQAYLNVLEELDCEAEKIIFFDDNRINVEAARAVGMNSVLVAGLDDLKQRLMELDIATDHCNTGR